MHTEVAMEKTHILAVAARAKAVAREAVSSIQDDVLGYLSACAAIDGTWSTALQAAREPAHDSTCFCCMYRLCLLDWILGH